MNASQVPGLTVMDHPLVDHKLSILRDHESPPHRFRQTLHELSWLLAYPAFAALKTEGVDIQTPLEVTSCQAMQPPIRALSRSCVPATVLSTVSARSAPRPVSGISAFTGIMTRWRRSPITTACQRISFSGR